jgi:hypothetical protein
MKKQILFYAVALSCIVSASFGAAESAGLKLG